MKTTPVIDYLTPDQQASGTWRGMAKWIVVFAAAVTVFALFMPSHVGSGVIRPNPLRILSTRLLLALGAWYILDRMLSTSDRPGSRIMMPWFAAVAALLFTYVQIWFLKDYWLYRRGPWRAAVLWPSACVLATILAFAVMRNMRWLPVGSTDHRIN